MSSTALAALVTAEAAGVRVTLDGDGLILESEPRLPADIVALLRTVKPDLLRILAGRETAKAALNAQPPPDCSPQRWDTAKAGLQRFISDGWGDQATLVGWTIEELYQVPPVWARIDLAGAALMIGDRRVVAVTGTSIAIERLSGSRLKFRRIGREHLA
jgi:hypothetical protein